MKRILLILLCAIFAFVLSSCGESVNMGALTEYQNADFCADLKITTAGREYRAELTKKGESLLLSVKEPSGLLPFTFVLTDSGTAVIAGGAEIPLASDELLHLGRVYPLFSVAVAGTWKIEKAHPGGVALYVCENGNITLYIDANSRLPLKIVSERAEADVLSFRISE